jgi:hypothetical protein
MAYQIPVPRGEARVDFPKPVRPEREPDEQVMERIQGKMPGSIQEYRVAKALDTLSLDYVFQYSLYGGTHVRGGIVVDFVVYLPFAHPLEVQSERWHTGKFSPHESFRMRRVERYFKRPVRFVYEDLLDSIPNSVTHVRKVLFSPAIVARY